MYDPRTATMSERLRHQAEIIRRAPVPLISLIPLLQQAADELDRLYVARKCPQCGGNDRDKPCGMPTQSPPGCLRKQRLEAQR